MVILFALLAASAQARDLEPAQPAWAGRLALVVENDAFVPGPSDSWYTHGVMLSYLSAPLAPGRFDRLFLPGSGGDAQRRIQFVVGQSMFTPENIQINPPDPRDRPFAGWLYTGVGFYQETNRNTLDHVELLIGVVGPAALAKQAQNILHTYTAPGWAFQLRNEPGFVLSYERRWRLDLISSFIEVDIIPQAGVSVGNIFTYAQVGGMIRVGHNIKADYGTLRIRPSLSGTGWFDASQLRSPIGWYLYAGAQVRGVARDIFLDGNTFQSSAKVTKVPLVADASVGISLFWLHYAKFDFVLTWRTKEFVDQIRTHTYGGATLSYAMP